MPIPTCIIAGAGPGLGLAVAERYADEGFSVYTLTRTPGLLASGIARLRTRGLHVSARECDLGKAAEVDREVKIIEAAGGTCDVFVYNAFVEDGHGIDVASAAAAVSTIVEAMRVKGAGAVLFSMYEGPEASVMLAFARGLAKETEPFGIRVGIVTIEGAMPVSAAKLTSIADAYWELFFSPDLRFEAEIRVQPDRLGERE